MRKIEQQMNDAIRSGKNWTLGNTSVKWVMNVGEQPRSEVFLHGNHIASVFHPTEGLSVNLYTLRRWPSMTTRSRLRALGANLVSIKGTLHLDGKSIWTD